MTDMNRRKFLLASGGIISVGGTAVASATRTDILADEELTRGKGKAVALENTNTLDSVTYLESTNEVRKNGNTLPFNKWARWECADIGASEVVFIVDNRLEPTVEGVGSGVASQIFGPVITADHTVTRDSDGTIVSEPNVTLDELISVAPRTVTVTVNLEGRGYATDIPVGVGQMRLLEH